MYKCKVLDMIYNVYFCILVEIINCDEVDVQTSSEEPER